MEQQQREATSTLTTTPSRQPNFPTRFVSTVPSPVTQPAPATSAAAGGRATSASISPPNGLEYTAPRQGSLPVGVGLSAMGVGSLGRYSPPDGGGTGISPQRTGPRPWSPATRTTTGAGGGGGGGGAGRYSPVRSEYKRAYSSSGGLEYYATNQQQSGGLEYYATNQQQSGVGGEAAAVPSSTTQQGGQLPVPYQEQHPNLPNVQIVERYETVIANLEQQISLQRDELTSLKHLLLKSQSDELLQTARQAQVELEYRADMNARRAEEGIPAPAGAAPVPSGAPYGTLSSKPGSVRGSSTGTRKKEHRHGASYHIPSTDDDDYDDYEEDGEEPRVDEETKEAIAASCQPLTQPCRRRIDRYVRRRFEKYATVLDEKIAESIAQRINRVAKEHVATTAHRELIRFLEEASLNPNHRDFELLAQVKELLREIDVRERGKNRPVEQEGAGMRKKSTAADGRRRPPREDEKDQNKKRYRPRSARHRSSSSTVTSTDSGSVQAEEDKAKRRSRASPTTTVSRQQRHHNAAAAGTTTRDFVSSAGGASSLRKGNPYYDATHQRLATAAATSRGTAVDDLLPECGSPTMRDVARRLKAVAGDIGALEGAYAQERILTENDIQDCLQNPKSFDQHDPTAAANPHRSPQRSHSPQATRTMAKFNEDMDGLLDRLKASRAKLYPTANAGVTPGPQ